MSHASAARSILHTPVWSLFVVVLLLLDVILVMISSQWELLFAWNCAVLFIILITATWISVQNALAHGDATRWFWFLIASGAGLWAINALLGLLYAAGPVKSLPEPMLSSSVLFLHTIFFLAAVAIRPHLTQVEQGPYRTTLNLLLLLFLLVFIYVFFLVPGRYLHRDFTALRWFSIVYFVENTILTIIIGVFAARTETVWKDIYLPLFLTSAVYSLTSLAISLRVASGVYHPGFLDSLTTLAACLLVWAAVRGKQLTPQLAPAVPGSSGHNYPKILALLSFTAIPVLGVWELLQIKQVGEIHTIRLFAVLIAGLLLTVTVFIEGYLEWRRFAADIDLARDQLHLAMESGKSMGWDLNLSSGKGTWFGDLQRFFGVQANHQIGAPRDFYRFVHPHDRRQLLRAISLAVQNAKPFAVIFRFVLPDSSATWVASHGRFYYKNSKPIRMLGVAVDVNEQKQAERALRENEDKLRLVLESAAEGIFGIDMEGRCTFCNPAAVRILGYSHPKDLMGHKIQDCIHHSRPDGTEYSGSESAILSTLQSGKEVHSTDEVFYRSDGTSFPVEYWALPKRRENQIVGAVVTFIDITERRRSEEALRESETRFRNMANTAPMLLWMSGENGRREYFNQSWLDFTGKPLEAHFLNGWTECIHPEDAARYLTVYTEASGMRQPFQVEYRLRRHDGEFRSILENSVPRFTLNGEFEGYIGCAIDLTEVRRAEREIALANERLQLAVEAGRAEVWDVDIRTGNKTTFGNHQMLFGVPAEEGESQNFWDCVHPEDRTALRESRQAAQRNKTPFRQEFRVLWPDGTVRWLHCEGKFEYSPSGEPERMLGITVDISDRKRSEEALQKSDQEFSLAFEAARLGWWVWDEESGDVLLSEGTRAVHGLFAARRITLHALLNAVHPEDRERVHRNWLQSLNEDAHYFVEYRVLRRDGSIHWLEARGRAYRSSSGKALQMVGVSMDITERKRAEESLRTLGGRLIQAQEQERVRIARELHDDMCQRLAILQIELERLRDSPGLPDPKLPQWVDHLAQFTGEIASSLQALSHGLHSSKLEILGTAVAMRSFCGEFADQHHVEIEFVSNISHLLPRDVSVCLYRVMQEALHNAVKHSGTHHFFVQLRGEPGAVELTVRDSGVGFDLETTAIGRGLGLISMQERVNLVNGTLSIESAPTRGTTIHVKIPVEEVHTSMIA